MRKLFRSKVISWFNGKWFYNNNSDCRQFEFLRLSSWANHREKSFWSYKTVFLCLPYLNFDKEKIQIKILSTVSFASVTHFLHIILHNGKIWIKSSKIVKSLAFPKCVFTYHLLLFGGKLFPYGCWLSLSSSSPSCSTHSHGQKTKHWLYRSSLLAILK